MNTKKINFYEGENVMDTAAKEIGKIIKEKRYELGQGVKFSQDKLAKRLNSEFNLTDNKFTQEKISMLERGNPRVKLSQQMIDSIHKYFQINDNIINLYKGELCSEKSNRSEGIRLLMHGSKNLITDKTSDIFEKYLGNYNCLFYSTDSNNPKYVKGSIVIDKSTESENCTASLSLYDSDGKAIKHYDGIFFINTYYDMCYCILIGNAEQEVNIIAARHIKNSIHDVFLNVGFAITCSSGYKKRPTVHRIIISRNEIDEDKIDLLLPQLKLNSDILYIPEDELNNLENNLDESSELYNYIKKAIDMIKQFGQKKIYYVIDESIIYDSNKISDNSEIRARIVSILRKITDNSYYNKISHTVYNICAEIIGRQKK